MDKKKIIINLTLAIFVIVILVIIYPRIECSIKTKEYLIDTYEIKSEIENIGCYNNKNITQEFFDLNCAPLIETHNSLIERWAKLKCVNVDINSLKITE